MKKLTVLTLAIVMLLTVFPLAISATAEEGESDDCDRACETRIHYQRVRNWNPSLCLHPHYNPSKLHRARIHYLHLYLR
jgi:hypothetical protein